MNLRRVNYSLSYYETKISEYTLLTEYNPKFINTKIKAITTQIEMMYHLNISHMTTNDVHGIVSISYPLEKLVIDIIGEKDKLKHFKIKSNRNMQQLKQVIKQYTPNEQKEIMYYMQSNGSTIDYSLIERLQRDLYTYKNKVSVVT
ncbi:MAG: pathogenicity island protein [Staphylococcus epidermidis]|uniref:pathogenicity island protein n=1 Tax=Staphylococcus TaxID=1279 RepID=UPI00066E806F|nr:MULTISPECIES: pathogenicity island protein [Staphylococcus]KAB2211651.1 pathogenicity island protein [Staphylococcus epidermidis]MBF9278966.1 pathogenicity island protein [Staphylococcus epidermidis]MBM5991241.1 pathogenicity island protein [Staphylococcus epidermidis]MCG1541728.1 pathogenicity island protein [Staphylococcus epidermidis]MDK7342891.1 pathogenicity island protein [Staphylococcus epidermidis]